MSERLEVTHEIGKEEPVLGPIIASIGPMHHHMYSSGDWETLERAALHIDYLAHPDEMQSRGVRSAGKGTYVISPIDASPKMSDDYKECTGVAVIGVDEETGENISFISHQNPTKVLEGLRDQFVADLQATLKTFKGRVRHDTIEVVFFGGKYLSSQSTEEKTHADAYRESVELVRDIIATDLGVDTHVAAAPNAEGGKIAALLDTKNRRIYIEYPEQRNHAFNTAFNARDIDDVDNELRNHL